MSPVLDHATDWSTAFETGWLAHLRATGSFDWTQYPRPRNAPLPASPGVSLSTARLLLISSAGAYLPDTQQPFLGDHPEGDFSIREIPFDTDLRTLAYAHGHYDHSARIADPGVLLPQSMLHERVQDGVLGGTTENWVSFMGYMPDVRRVIGETIPRVLEVAQREHADCALLVPS